MKALQLLTGTAALSKLREYAPIVVEGGTGRRDQRDPAEVARRVAAALRPQITERQAILVTQGDPLEPTGISAITRAVAEELAIPRALVTLPAAIDPQHAPNAPRDGVVLELGYDALAASLENLAVAALRLAPSKQELADTGAGFLINDRALWLNTTDKGQKWMSEAAEKWNLSCRAITRKNFPEKNDLQIVGNCLNAIGNKFDKIVRDERISAWKKKIGRALYGKHSKDATAALRRHLCKQT